MRKISMALLFAASATIVFGQTDIQQRTSNTTSPKEMVEDGKDAFKQLNLKKKQKEKFEVITNKYKQEMATAMRANKGKRGAMQNVLKEINERKNADVKKVLKKKQFVTYLALQKERMEKTKARGYGKSVKPSKMGTRGQIGNVKSKHTDLYKSMNLSAVQIEKMTAIRNKFKGQMQSIRNGNADEVSMKKRLDIITMQKNAEVKSVLNPAQFLQYEKAMSEKGGMNKPHPNKSGKSNMSTTRPNGKPVVRPNGNVSTTRPSGRPNASNAITPNIINQLNLNPTQKTRFNSTVTAFQSKMRNVMKANSGDPAKTKTQLALVLAQRNKAIQSILDAKQFALFSKLISGKQIQR